MSHIIRAKNLVKRFGDLVAVHDVTFDVEKGEIFGFLGPNGAGKSTTIKMLTTLLQPTAGKIELDGMDVVEEPEAVRHSFGIIFQDPSLDSELTAYENMEYHAVLYGVERSQYLPRIQELMELVELWDRRDSIINTFSGGMKRRLEIARGLLHHPKVLFLDEPTLGLDPQTRNLMWDYIKKLNQKEDLTVFFTTHYMEEAERMANRIAIIDHGHIIASGSADALKNQTKTDSLEEAFLKLTGKEIREEAPESAFRTRAKMWGRR